MINFNKKDHVADAVKDVLQQEELKGNQKKIDKNHNGKLDKQDFEILRAKKEDVKGIEEGLQQTLRKVVPGYAKREIDKKMDDEKFGRTDVDRDTNYYRYKKIQDKLKKEEVESVEENAFDYKSPRQPEPNGGSGVKKGSRYGGSNQKPDYLDMDKDGDKKESMKKAIKDKVTKEEFEQIDEKKTLNDLLRKKLGIKPTLGYLLRKRLKTNEEAEQIDELEYTEEVVNEKKMKGTDPCWTGYQMVGMKDKAGKKVPNCVPEEVGQSFSHLRTKLQLEEVILDDLINEVLSKDASAGDWIHDFIHSDNPKFSGKSKAERKKMALGAYYGKQNEAAGPTSQSPDLTDVPWDPEGTRLIKKPVTDKSGATHNTPESRVKSLAQNAMKKVQSDLGKK